MHWHTRRIEAHLTCVYSIRCCIRSSPRRWLHIQRACQLRWGRAEDGSFGSCRGQRFVQMTLVGRHADGRRWWRLRWHCWTASWRQRWWRFCWRYVGGFDTHWRFLCTSSLCLLIKLLESQIGTFIWERSHRIRHMRCWTIRGLALQRTCATRELVPAARVRGTACCRCCHDR